MTATVQVELPSSLCRLASCPRTFALEVSEPATQGALLDALETQYPMLQGCLRDHTTRVRRPFIRFFASMQDLSHLAPDDVLPDAVIAGREPFLILGAIAGG